MITIIFLIIAVSFDAMSYGLAQGLKNIKIKFHTTLIMSTLSTILFTIPLYLSKYVAQYLRENVLDIVNGLILILLGVYYLYTYFRDKNINTYEEKLENQTSLQLNASILATFPISIDAIFTAFLNGYELNYILFGIVFYFFITFFSISITNIIGLKLSKRTKLNLGFLSSLIFFIIGTLKLFGI